MAGYDATSCAASAGAATSIACRHATPDRDRSRGERPTLCPVCDYSLACLPEAHRCPECGFTFDAETRIWEETNAWTPAKSAALLVHSGIFLLTLATLGAVYWKSGACPDNLLRLLLGYMALFSVLFVSQWIWNHRRQFVAVAPCGVLIRTTNWQTRIIPWQRVKRVVPGPGAMPTFAVLAVKGSNRFALRPALCSSEAVREFARAVEQGLRRHAV